MRKTTRTGPRRNIPVISYLLRNASLILCFVAAYLLSQWEAVFQAAGPMIYLPVMFSGAVIAATLIRHFFWRNTVDAFVQDGSFKTAWRELSPVEQIRWTFAITLTLILCASLVAAAIAK